MEIFALLVLFGIGQEINNNIDKIEDLSAQVELQDKWIHDLENHVAEIDNNVDKIIRDYIRLGAMHASHAARSNGADDQHDRKIENTIGFVESLEHKLEYVNKKVQTLHP